MSFFALNGVGRVWIMDGSDDQEIVTKKIPGSLFAVFYGREYRARQKIFTRMILKKLMAVAHGEQIETHLKYR